LNAKPGKRLKKKPLDYNRSAKIDLHIHSTASDGTLSPAEIITLARQLRLAAISITDHDSVDGAREALEAGIPESLEFLAGIEISTNPPDDFGITGSFHVLGYGIRVDHGALNRALCEQQEARTNRNPQIIEKLNRLGVEITYTEVTASVADGQVGRPHIARQLIKKGYAATINDAFDRYLGTGQPAYVDKSRIPCDRAIELILAAGGIPVMAHPYLYESGDHRRIDHMAGTLREMGMEGIEVYYPDHSPEQTARYEQVAAKHGLVMTGGTDFHGQLKPDIQMGVGKGDLTVPYTLYRTLIERWRTGAQS
jgi:3',5'-nucleoside bisphosphate phosphatase